MKHFLIILLTLTGFISCESESSTVYEEVDLERKLIVNIDYIKSISQEGFTSFEMETLYDKSETFTHIEDDLTIKAIEAGYVNTDTNWRIYSEYYGLQAFQWDMIENNFCFTFFKQNQECCFSQYCCVTNTEGKIKSISSFGTVGGDGGWSIYSEGEITHPGTYHMYEDEFEIDYRSNDGEGMEIEIQTHVEYFLRFQDSLFIRGEIINDFTMTDTTVMELGC